MKPNDGFAFLELENDVFVVKDIAYSKNHNKTIKIGDKVNVIRAELILRVDKVYIYRIDSIFAILQNDKDEGELLVE